MEAHYFQLQQLPQPLLSGGAFEPLSQAMNVDDAYLNGVYSGMLTFQSLLSPATSISSNVVNNLNDDPSLLYRMLPEPPSTFSLPPLSSSYAESLKLPKLETFVIPSPDHACTEPYNFFPETTSAPHPHRLPSHFYLQNLTESAQYLYPDSVTQNYQFQLGSSSTKNYEKREVMRRSSASLSKSKEVATRRRRTISEKTRCLQKLLPWDKKMDTATMLEEAYRYVKFLEAQVSVLKSMPQAITAASDGDSAASSSSLRFGNGNISNGDGDEKKEIQRLGKLNRQQVLQVMVNSPVVQTVLSRRGWCLYSVEQVALLKKNAETTDMYQQMLFR